MCGDKRKRRAVLNGNDDGHSNLSLSLSPVNERKAKIRWFFWTCYGEAMHISTHLDIHPHLSLQSWRRMIDSGQRQRERERERERSRRRRWRFPLLQSIYWSLAWPLQSSISTKRRKVTCTLPLGNRDREKWRRHWRRKPDRVMQYLGKRWHGKSVMSQQPISPQFDKFH